MSRHRLFEVDSGTRRTGFSKELVPVATESCPDCDSPMESTTIHEPALLRHGGYGATARTTVVRCSNRGCRWWMETERTEVRPTSEADG